MPIKLAALAKITKFAPFLPNSRTRVVKPFWRTFSCPASYFRKRLQCALVSWPILNHGNRYFSTFRLNQQIFHALVDSTQRSQFCLSGQFLWQIGGTNQTQQREFRGWIFRYPFFRQYFPDSFDTRTNFKLFSIFMPKYFGNEKQCILQFFNL